LGGVNNQSKDSQNLQQQPAINEASGARLDTTAESSSAATQSSSTIDNSQLGGINNQPKDAEKIGNNTAIESNATTDAQPAAEAQPAPVISNEELGGVNNQSKDATRLDPNLNESGDLSGSRVGRNDAGGTSTNQTNRVQETSPEGSK
jgi:hypothetical protein